MTRKRAQRHKGRAGFTLFEIMVSVAILSVGLIFIYEAMLFCLNVFSYYANHLSVQSWMGQKMWIAEDDLMRTEGETEGTTKGKFMSRNKKIDWIMSVTPVMEGTLYELSLVCSWQEGKKRVSLSRAAYAGIGVAEE